MRLSSLLMWPLFGPAADITAADHRCLSLEEGEFTVLAAPGRVVAVGLSYATHLRETGETRAPGQVPPVFSKRWTPTTSEVRLPDEAALARAASSLDPRLDPGDDPLLDYEVELGIVALEDLDPADLDDPMRAPRVGFFVANDLSARALGVLGEGAPDPYAWWGVSKSFEGFLPTGRRMWVPDRPVRDGLPCVRLRTLVNGEVRQDQLTSDMVFTTTDLLRAVAASGPLRAGDWVLTGTPGGVAVQTPAWKRRLADLLGLGPETRLAALRRGRGRFLKAGDTVRVEAEGLDAVEVRIVAR